jgi:hypothetical protein
MMHNCQAQAKMRIDISTDIKESVKVTLKKNLSEVAYVPLLFCSGEQSTYGYITVNFWIFILLHNLPYTVMRSLETAHEHFLILLYTPP